ncbi:WYL domain-containing protein [Corynebacterium pelargi]|uniref:Uncharacterized protein n=1 Tax=Corynebacterium pelargi TaxID=1471400 RepID=A0A410W8W0_9CORY|nr:WYL domain-containing protein [Corynebacterium pelargi]QAU52390.1 hypothetical protein CPELA_05595 [Corynebacterium pelargi]GGG68008.1 hypothetical protein GCM10007338_00780 [Corynebacterium pelargi]
MTSAQSTHRSGKLADLVRVLNLVQYWQQHPGVALSTAAADLGVDIAQLKEDSYLLTTCGFGQYPDELFDLKVENRGVEVINDLGLDTPLRLTSLEAGSLLLAMQTLQQMPGMAPSEVVQSVSEKLRRYLGNTDAGFDISALDQPLERNEVLAAINQALEQKRQLRFQYQNSIGETRQHQVSVAAVLSAKGATYIKAYVADLGTHRTFRTDRMQHVELSDAKATPHLSLESARFSPEDPFGLQAVQQRAELSVLPEAAWILDQIETIDVAYEELIHITVPVASAEWLERFVLSNADRAWVDSPTQLCQSLAQRALDGLNAYDEQP